MMGDASTVKVFSTTTEYVTITLTKADALKFYAWMNACGEDGAYIPSHRNPSANVAIASQVWDDLGKVML